VTLSLEQLKEINRIKGLHGYEAELYVEKYEKQRLFNHPSINKIRIISNLDVGAGYDIVSFNSNTSETIDRFIEVKSFAKYLSFYWSRNEVEMARLKGDNYFLYLIDRSKMEDATYKPLIIQNPFTTVFLADEWLKQENLWYVTNQKPYVVYTQQNNELDVND
jgi:hypothetical protein